MTTPSIDTVQFTTMTPDIQPALPEYIDQQSTGRNGMDSVFDAYRIDEQTIVTTQVAQSYAEALLSRASHRSLQNTIQTVTDASGAMFANTRIRRARRPWPMRKPMAAAVVTEWDILVASP